MKGIRQIREFVRRRCLQEREIQFKYRDKSDAFWPRSYARTRELAFIEVLNAIDTPNNRKLKMPREPRYYRNL